MAAITQADLEAVKRIVAVEPNIGRIELGRRLAIGEDRAARLLGKVRSGGGPTPIGNNGGCGPAEPEVVLLRKQISDLRKDLAEAQESRFFDAEYQKFIGRIERARVTIPSWIRPPASGKKHFVVPVLNWSDWHLDEQVRPEEIMWLNGYGRKTALMRLEKFTENGIRVPMHFLNGFDYSGGLVVNSLGDIFSGSIHEELRRTNGDVMLSSMLYWIGPVCAMFKTFADAFGKVHVNVVVGNHGRNTVKPIFKGRVRDNFDWFFMQTVARELSGDKRITFNIPDGMKLVFDILGHRFLASHGDECKGGSGIAGMLSPQLIAYARMKKTYDFTTWVLGHWHHLAAYRNIRVNGSGKGFDEYALGNNFDFQEPQQDFFLVDAKRGVIGGLPIFCAADNEPWRKAAAAVA